jgi:hypothetical protein
LPTVHKYKDTKMREFTIRSGKFAGKHILYDTVEEAKSHGIKEIVSPWYLADTGYWCVSDDGYVIQCLHKFKLVNKRHLSGQYTDSFRFPNGTFYVFYDRNGERHIKNFYGQITNQNQTSLGNTSRLGKYMTAKKKLFVTLVAGGMEPYAAYVKAYSKGYKNNIVMQVNKLLDDPLVRKALMTEMKPFMEEVERKVKEKTGSDSLVDFLTDQIATLITTEKGMGAKDRRENIKMMVALFGEQLGLTHPKTTQAKREIEEADYKMIAPPELGPI